MIGKTRNDEPQPRRCKMAIHIKPEFNATTNKWRILSVIDEKKTPISGIEPNSFDAAQKFIEEETTLLREYCEAHSGLTIVSFYLYSNGITNAEAGTAFAKKWQKRGVKVW